MILVVFATALKGAPLNLLAGLSYEVLDSFHRLMGRLIVVMFLLHGGLHIYFAISVSGTPASHYFARNDIQMGIASLSCILLLMILYGLVFCNLQSAIRPIRTALNELFRWSHWMLTVGFLLCAYLHKPQVRVYMEVALVVLAVDWLPRFVKMCLPMPTAETKVFPGNLVRLTIPRPTNFLARLLWNKWTPGQHARITIPAIGLLQPHPFTIASIPEDGGIQLFIRA